MEKKSISISRITPWRIAGTLSLTENGEGVDIPKFFIIHTISGLLRGKISTLLFDSATVDLVMAEGRLSVKGFAVSSGSNSKNNSPLPVAAPFTVDKIVLKNCTVNLQRENLLKKQYINISGALDLRYEDTADRRNIIAGLEGGLNVRGDLGGEVYFRSEKWEEGYANSYKVKVDDLSSLKKYIEDAEDLAEFSGSALLSGKIYTRGFGEIVEYKATSVFKDFSLGRGGLKIGGVPGGDSLQLELSGNSRDANITISGGFVGFPEKFKVNLAAGYTFGSGSYKGKADIVPQRTGKPLQLDFTGRAQGTAFETEYHLTGESFSLGEDLQVGSYAINGSLHVNQGLIRGELFAGLSKILLQQGRFFAEDISLNLPFSFALKDNDVSVPGELSIKKMGYKGVNSAGLKASILASKGQVEISALLKTPLDDRLSVSCSGLAQLPGDASLSCYLPETGIDSAIFPEYVVLPASLSFSGKLRGELALEYVDGLFTGWAKTDLRQGHASWQEHKLSDISLSLELPDLPKIRSAPGQVCSVGSIDFGKIKMSDAKIRWRIDDITSIFVEKVALRWCGGRVETGVLSLSKGMETLEATLYCDRLGYTELLNQFGIGNAEGEGALNGRLPIRINRDGVQFDDGFLFSTPGNSGIVRFTNTRQLRESMPAADKAAYLDYSLKALENFSYNWTKLRFNTVGEELLLSLQLDGKPVEPLPYGYKQGQIIKTNKGSGLQHPIRLDVNFRLPLNDLFRYGKSIQSIMENM